MMRAAIRREELSALPFPTLAAIAMAAAHDVDAGEEDKRALVETVLEAIRKTK